MKGEVWCWEGIPDSSSAQDIRFFQVSRVIETQHNNWLRFQEGWVHLAQGPWKIERFIIE